VKVVDISGGKKRTYVKEEINEFATVRTKLSETYAAV
jgi:hypothetical protein